MAIQLPNGKISRTLPEQVGFNSEKIYEIIKFLNESGLKDLVISVDAASGTLTPEQLAIAELSPSYVLYGGKVYVKALEDLTNIDYFQVGVNISGSTEYQASVERVRVVRDTRAYAVETVNLFESYTSDQVDSLLAGLESVYAKLSGANFTGPITAPSIIENMSGYTFTAATVSQMTYDFAYAGACKNGNKLTLVVAGTIKRTSSGIYSAKICDFNIPSAVGEKLFPSVGSVLEYKQVYCAIDQETGTSLPFRVQKASNTNLTFWIDKANTLTQDTVYFVRFEITFLLSTNLIS